MKIGHFGENLTFFVRFSTKWEISMKIWKSHMFRKSRKKCDIFTPLLYFLKVNHYSKFCAFLFWYFQRNSAITQVLKSKATKNIQTHKGTCRNWHLRSVLTSSALDKKLTNCRISMSRVPIIILKSTCNTLY